MATKEAKEIIIPAIQINTIVVNLKGTTPLIMHKWSEKAKKEMLDKQMKKAKTKGHDVKDPVRDFIDSLYWLEGEPKEKTEEGFMEAIQNGAKFGFPSVAFKASAVSAGYRSGATKDKVSVNASFHIDGDMVEIEGTPEMREDMVRVGMGTADIRYRGEFKEWSAKFVVRYNAGAISSEQILNLFQLGGFACGIGEWRPEKGGSNGMYEIC